MKGFLPLALLLVAGRATATSGNVLLEQARSYERVQQLRGTDRDAQHGAFYQGFVAGAAFTLDDLDPTVCLPSGGNVGQFAAVVRQYLDGNPARLHLQAERLVKEALQRAFPCR
jgi:hypothetical protein